MWYKRDSYHTQASVNEMAMTLEQRAGLTDEFRKEKEASEAEQKKNGIKDPKFAVSTWYENKKKEYEGDDFLAPETFRKDLVKAGIIPDRSPRSTSPNNTPTPNHSTKETIENTPLTDDERSDFDGFDKNIFAEWVASNKPGVWRAFFDKDRQHDIVKKQLADAMSYIKELEAKIPKGGAN